MWFCISYWGRTDRTVTGEHDVAAFQVECSWVAAHIEFADIWGCQLGLRLAGKSRLTVSTVESVAHTAFGAVAHGTGI